METEKQRVKFGFTSNPFAIPGLTLLGLAAGFALSIILRKEKRE